MRHCNEPRNPASPVNNLKGSSTERVYDLSTARGRHDGPLRSAYSGVGLLLGARGW